MLTLIQNEIYKMLLKKKFLLIVILLIIFISLFAYGEQYVYEKNLEEYGNFEQSGTYDWKTIANQRLDKLYSRLDSPYIPDSGINSIKIEIEQLEYFIENDINPITPSVARFTVEFMQQSMLLFLPLLVAILGADIISGEFSTKTIKVLLTRAVPRWKILFSKLIALLLMTTLMILMTNILSIVISYLFLGRWGFNEPVATGFRFMQGTLNSTAVVLMSRTQYMILIYSLGWLVAMTIATITLMISVVVTSTASTIGILIAALIGGQFLQFFLSDWTFVKYFFVTNLELTKYLTGSYTPIENMSLLFSIGVLLMWGIISIVVSFYVFSTKDIYA
jgi:ABC-2 type transport system permease protein